MNDLGDQDFLNFQLFVCFFNCLFAFSMWLLAFPIVLKAPGGSLKTFAG